MRFEPSTRTARRCVVGPTLALLLSTAGACGSSGGQKPGPGAAGTSGSAGTTGTAGGGGSLGSAGAAGTSGAAGTTGSAGSTGAAGTTGSGGSVGSTGAAGTTGAGGSSNPDAGPITDGGAGDFPKADCAPGAIFCDGFEDYTVQAAFDSAGNLRDFIKTGETTPTWLSYHFHGPPYVVTDMPFKGTKDYSLDTETGHIAAADIIKESPDGVDLWPAAHYGRVMLQLKNIPPKGPVGLVTESGLLPGSTTNTAQYTLGLVNGKLAVIYTQRKRPYKNDVSAPKMRIGGNWETTAQMPTTQCTVAATTQTITASQWVCLEWMVDRTKPEVHVWLNGVAQTEVDVSGSGGTCSAGTAATWTGPEHFTELDLGFEMWGNDTNGGAWKAWYDEFAVGTQRLGCPTK